MRIEIDLSVANDPDAHRWLDRILHKIEDGWHVWDTTYQSDPDAFRTTTWISGRGDQGRRIIEMLVAAAGRSVWSLAPHERCVRITMHPNTVNDLKPEEAARLAEEPLVILVENRFSDGAFVRRVVKELDRRLFGLWRKPGNPIRFDSLGGTGQMVDEVECRVQGKPVRPRLVTIVDSGRTHPGATVDPAAQRLHRECQNLNVPCWVLAKRESENYLPRVLLTESENPSSGHDQLVEAWDDLNDDQKNFFDMKDGLPDEPSMPEEELFQGLSSRSRTILSRGFGKNVHKCWTLWHVQAGPELLTRGQGDLERGIALIRKEV